MSSNITASKPTYNWVKVTENAGWQARDSQGEVTYDGRMWIFGGWFNVTSAPPRDVWSSADGKSWDRITDDAPWKHSDLPMTITFNGRMWLMGGWYNGKLPGCEAGNEVWSSTDGKQWELATGYAGWKPRMAAAIVEFKGRMWILGGTSEYYDGDDSSLLNDVWSSADGKEWTCATASAPWSPRTYLQAAVLNDRIYVYGGGNFDPEFFTKNDVWSSADGENWRLETENAPWAGRIWFSAAVYRGHMWVIGGCSQNAANNHDDNWYSKDGQNWKQLKSDIVWKKRHEHSVFVHDDKLWVAGGHAIPLNSEVWSLELPENFGDE